MGRSLMEQLQGDAQRIVLEEKTKRREELLLQKKEQKKQKLKMKENQEILKKKIMEQVEIQKRIQEEQEAQEELEQQGKLRTIFAPFIDNFKKYYIPTDTIYRLAYNEAFDWLKKQSPNSTKPLSKKNRMRLEGKSFLIYVNENYTYVLAKVTNADSVKSFRIEAATITPVRTEKGLLYFLLDKGDLAHKRNYLPITAITAHVFDRYAERCFDDDLSRMEAIRSYCSEQVSGWVLKTESEYMKPTKNGVSLGEYAYIPDTEHDENNMFLFLEKTFIRSDMMFKQQDDTISESLIEFHKSRGTQKNLNNEGHIKVEHKRGEPIYLP